VEALPGRPAGRAGALEPALAAGEFDQGTALDWARARPTPELKASNRPSRTQLTLQR